MAGGADGRAGVNPRPAKMRLHQALQDAAEGHPGLDGAMLTRWLVITEFALPDGSMSLGRMTGTADGADMRSWEAAGFLHEMLHNPAHRPR